MHYWKKGIPDIISTEKDNWVIGYVYYGSTNNGGDITINTGGSVVKLLSIRKLCATPADSNG